MPHALHYSSRAPAYKRRRVVRHIAHTVGARRVLPPLTHACVYIYRRTQTEIYRALAQALKLVYGFPVQHLDCNARARERERAHACSPASRSWAEECSPLEPKGARLCANSHLGAREERKPVSACMCACTEGGGGGGWRAAGIYTRARRTSMHQARLHVCAWVCDRACVYACRYRCLVKENREGWGVRVRGRDIGGWKW